MMMNWADMNWEQGVPLTAGMLRWGLVQSAPETAEFWSRMENDGVLVLKRCDKCGACNHPRKVACVQCYGMNFKWVPASGGGSIYTCSTLYRPPSPDMADKVPYTLGLVILDEGVPFFGRIDGLRDGEQAIGLSVTASAKRISGRMMPVFEINR